MCFININETFAYKYMKIISKYLSANISNSGISARLAPSLIQLYYFDNVTITKLKNKPVSGKFINNNHVTKLAGNSSKSPELLAK